MGEKSDPCVVVAWRDRDLAGYAPLMKTVDSLGPFSVSALKFIGNNIGSPGDILYADILAEEPQKQITEAILSHVKSNWHVTKWDFGYLDPRSSTYAVARDLLGMPGDAARLLKHQYYISLWLPASWDAYLMTLSRKARKNFYRGWRGLGEIGELRIRVDKDSETVSRRVAELIQNHAMWWQGTSKEGWFGDESVHRFLIEGAGLLARLGQYLAFTMELDKTPIAWSVGPFDDQRYIEHLVSYDRTFASHSPGIILSILLMRNLLSTDIHQFELGPGFDRYKRSLGGKPTTYIHLQGYLGWLRHVVKFRKLLRSEA